MEWNESNYSRDTAMRLARAGALVRIVCAEDACAVCQSRAQRVYAPADVPRLPIRGCLHAACRCRFVAVDPETELTVPQVIMVQLGRRADFPLASALAIVLMGIVTLAYLASARWLRLDRL